MKLSLMTFMCEFPLLMEGAWTREKSDEVIKLLHSVKKAGFKGIDLISKTVEHLGTETVKQLLEELDLELTSLICFYELSNSSIPDTQALAPYLNGLEMAHDLGCAHLMLVPGDPGPADDPASIRETLKRRFRIITEAAKEYGIQCMIEDDPNLRIGLCALTDVRAMIQAVPDLKIVYDTANMIVAGEDPVAYYEALYQDVIHMHIKDIRICTGNEIHKDHGLDGKDYVSAPHGSGLVNFEALFGSFAAHGYDDVMSLEYVPSGNASVEEEITAIHNRFLSLASRFYTGVNEVGLISKLVTEPWEDVWKELRELGVSSVEVCALPDHTEGIRKYAEELAQKYPVGMPDCLARGDRIYALVEGIRSCALQVTSCHVMLCEAYPEVITECIPYMKRIHDRTGIRQFVVSCMFETASQTLRYLPFLQKAAASLKEDGITLCYHNHHMDSMELENGKTAMEMVLEECPDCMIQLDIGWAWYGNMDSLAFMEKYGSRIASIHLKDLTSDARERTDDGRFTAVGSGSAPTKEVLEHLHLSHISPGYLIIDQDASAHDMYQDIASGIRFIRQLQ